MTETTTTEPTSTEPEAPQEAPSATLEELIEATPVTYQEMARVNTALLNEWANQANTLVTNVKASQNVETTIQDLIDESDDETLVRYRAYVTEQEALLQQAFEGAREHVKNNLINTADTIDPEAALAEWKTLNTQYTSLSDVTTKMGKLAGFDGEALVKAVTPMEGMGRRRGSKGGSDIRRPRVSRIRYRISGTQDWTVSEKVTVKDGVTERKAGFTPLGQDLRKAFGKVDDGQLRMEADRAAGTQEWASLDGKPFTFVVTIPKKDDPNSSTIVEVEVTPKAPEVKAPEVTEVATPSE